MFRLFIIQETRQKDIFMFVTAMELATGVVSKVEGGEKEKVKSGSENTLYTE